MILLYSTLKKESLSHIAQNKKRIRKINTFSGNLELGVGVLKNYLTNGNGKQDHTGPVHQWLFSKKPYKRYAKVRVSTHCYVGCSLELSYSGNNFRMQNS